MRYGFLLLGEHEEFGKLEILNLLNSYSHARIVDEDDRILIMESEPPDRTFFDRLAMVRESFIHIDTVDIDYLERRFKDLNFEGKRVCVRVKKLNKSLAISTVELERKLGAILYRNGAIIDLKDSDITIKVYITDRCHIGILNHVTNTAQFFERRPDKKPFFKPGALLPRLARALVNFTGITDDTLLDPMCGTGTILIEAGLMGIDFVGIEAFKKVLYGCAENLIYYNLPVNLIRGDARNISLRDDTVSAIVTDYPYLRSSKSFGELSELYERSFEEISRVLKKGKRLVIVSNIDVEERYSIENYFKIERKLFQRVHKNLYRRIYILQNR
ncbi:putative DNA modification methylase [Archaeoglobus sulfaticallidus PM70-1]|uniref:tRNA (guanine(10)-N(2))-dimethyltransferase n=1 Tax=Archaeoglobus sulfaticallidus PM70-1 TaxID=387631 RepID=N0BCX4_9EURY|nr:THUMP domain-containing protein [Archaeoglobus sulfaticallidus]AGK60863.1 putative DNA modification methylase [Archaeoglobus sulfaticallidus PM70-1]